MVIMITIAIVKQANKKVRNYCIVASAIAFLFAGGLTVYTSQKAFIKIKEKGSETTHLLVEAFAEHLSAHYPNSFYMDSIKNIQPDNVKIPIPYFYCAGFSNYDRMPLIYPYSMVSVDSLLVGEIKDETGLDNIFNDASKSTSVITNISKFYFDKNLIATESVSDHNQDTLFNVLEFDSKQTYKFAERSALDKFLTSKGYNLPIKMMNIKDYHQKF